MKDREQELGKLETEYTPEAIAGNFEGKHILSVDQFEREDLDFLFGVTSRFREMSRDKDSKRELLHLCQGDQMAVMFFEGSTRTDFSFQMAMRRLGGDVTAASNGIQFSSVYKGENLADTVRAIGCYADIIVLRHPDIGSSYEAAFYLDEFNSQIHKNRPPLLSGGDGIGEHPSQALLDMFTIEDLKGGDDLNITMVGDLRHGRTVHSLSKLIARNSPRNVRLLLVSPDSLKMPPEIMATLQEHCCEVHETNELLDVISCSDVIYWTRVQEERFSDPEDYARIRDSFIFTPDLLRHVKKDAIIMHPLPRKHEMGSQADHRILDNDHRTIYFRQMENGLFVRMAAVASVLGRVDSSFL